MGLLDSILSLAYFFLVLFLLMQGIHNLKECYAALKRYRSGKKVQYEKSIQHLAPGAGAVFAGIITFFLLSIPALIEGLFYGENDSILFRTATGLAFEYEILGKTFSASGAPSTPDAVAQVMLDIVPVHFWQLILFLIGFFAYRVLTSRFTLWFLEPAALMRSRLPVDFENSDPGTPPVLSPYTSFISGTIFFLIGGGMLLFPSAAEQYEIISGRDMGGFLSVISDLQDFILLSSQSNHHVFQNSHIADFLPCVLALVGMGILEFTARGLSEKTRPPYTGNQSGIHLAFQRNQFDFLEDLQKTVGSVEPLFASPMSTGRSPRTEDIDRGALKRTVAETHEEYRFETLDTENPFWSDILERLNVSQLYTTQWEVIQKTATGQKAVLSMEPGSGKMLSVFLSAMYQVVQRFQSVLILVPDDSVADEIKARYYSRIQDLHWMQGLSLQILTSDEERRDTGHVTALAMQELPSERQPDIVLATPDRLHALLKTRDRARTFIQNLGFVAIVEGALHGHIQSLHTAMVMRRFFTMVRLVFRGRYGARWMGEDGFPELGVLVTLANCSNPDAFASFLTGLDFLPTNVISASQAPVRPKNVYTIQVDSRKTEGSPAPLAIFDAALQNGQIPLLLLGYGERLILADKIRMAQFIEQSSGHPRSDVLNSMFLESELVRGRENEGFLENSWQLLESKVAVLDPSYDPGKSILINSMGLFSAGEPPLILIPIAEEMDRIRARRILSDAGLWPGTTSRSPQMIIPDFDSRTLPILQSHLHCLFEEMDRSFLKGYSQSDLLSFFGGGLNHRMSDLIHTCIQDMLAAQMIRPVESEAGPSYEAVSTLQDIYDFPFDTVSQKSSVSVTVLNTTKVKMLESFDLEFNHPPGSVVMFDGKRRRLLQSTEKERQSSSAVMLGADHETFYSKTRIQLLNDFWEYFEKNRANYDIEKRFLGADEQSISVQLIRPKKSEPDARTTVDPGNREGNGLEVHWLAGEIEYRDAITDRIISRTAIETDEQNNRGTLFLNADEILHILIAPEGKPLLNKEEADEPETMNEPEDSAKHNSEASAANETAANHTATDLTTADETAANISAEKESEASESEVARSIALFAEELRKGIALLVANPEDMLEIRVQTGSGVFLTFIHKPVFSSNLLSIIESDLCGENLQGTSRIFAGMAENPKLLESFPFLKTFQNAPGSASEVPPLLEESWDNVVVEEHL